MTHRFFPTNRLSPPLQGASAWHGPALKAQVNRLERINAAEVPPGAKPGLEIPVIDGVAGRHRLAHSALERAVRRAVAWTPGRLSP